MDFVYRNIVIGVYWLLCLETFQQADMGMHFKCPQGQRVLDDDPFIPHAWPIFHTGLCNMHRQCITRMETYEKNIEFILLGNSKEKNNFLLTILETKKI